MRESSFHPITGQNESTTLQVCKQTYRAVTLKDKSPVSTSSLSQRLPSRNFH
ncbi:hypothetical protein E5C01_00415 [Bacteroides fragilis]|nr:hypothetical protein E5C01_00415 [Bacteroides fragilis]RGN98437.1 hypothetical protein DXB33_15590 [Bacteroides fragilis]RGO58407.1 hypothetical protein DXB09_17105 [Bacteroides fragilis]